MEIVEIRRIFSSGNLQQLEMMARAILTNGRSHEYVLNLSQHANEFNTLLSAIDKKHKEYLALVYILAEHLCEVKGGACACSIVQKPMFNSPERLTGILEILSETFVAESYSVNIYSRCLACGKEYGSRLVESGFGQKVTWIVYRTTPK